MEPFNRKGSSLGSIKVKTKKFENALTEADYFSKLSKEDALKFCVFVEDFVKAKSLLIGGIIEGKSTAISKTVITTPPKPKLTKRSSSDTKRNKRFIVPKPQSAKLCMKKLMDIVSPNEPIFQMMNKEIEDCSKTPNRTEKQPFLRELEEPATKNCSNKEILPAGCTGVSQLHGCELAVDDISHSEQEALKEFEIIENMLNTVQHCTIRAENPRNDNSLKDITEMKEIENWKDEGNKPDEFRETKGSSSKCSPTQLAGDGGMDCENEDTWINTLVDSISTLDSKTTQ